MRRFLWAIAGLVAGAAVTLGIGLLLPEILTISQAEGAYAMGLVFFWMPVGGVLGAICGALFAPARKG